MEIPSFYKAIGTVPLKGGLIPMPGTEGATPELLFGDPSFPDFSVAGLVAAPIPDEIPSLRLRQISANHGRSYELDIDGMEVIGAWSDEHGILFSSLTIKGNNFDDPKIRLSIVTPQGFDVYGLQDLDFIRRTVVASDVLRELGIETEATIGIVKPEEMISVGSASVDEESFKENVLAKSTSRNAIRLSRIPVLGRIPIYKNARKQDEYLDQAQFVFSVRAMQVSERMNDLMMFEDRDDLEAVIKRAFDFVNFSEALKAENESGYVPEHFDIYSEEDVLRYFTRYLPRKIGRYFAIMHSNGLVHEFPHSGNISTVGSIYDLDSVRGEKLGLGDDPAKSTEYVDDIDTAITGLMGVLTNKHFASIFQAELPPEIKLDREFKREFLKSYMSSIDPKSVQPEFGKALFRILLMEIELDLYQGYHQNLHQVLEAMLAKVVDNPVEGLESHLPYDLTFNLYVDYFEQKVENISIDDFSDRQGTVKETPGVISFREFLKPLVSRYFDQLNPDHPKDFIRDLYIYSYLEKLDDELSANIKDFYAVTNRLNRLYNVARSRFMNSKNNRK